MRLSKIELFTETMLINVKVFQTSFLLPGTQEMNVTLFGELIRCAMIPGTSKFDMNLPKSTDPSTG